MGCTVLLTYKHFWLFLLKLIFLFGYFLRVITEPYFPFLFPDLGLSPLVLMAFWGHVQASGREGGFIVFLFYCLQSHNNITQ